VGRERRGCLRADLELEGLGLLHVFNVHLGTAFLDAGTRLENSWIGPYSKTKNWAARASLLGDFNEWTRGLTTKLLSAHLKSADIRSLLQRSKTYPGVMPILHLDHIYFEDSLEMESLNLHRSRRALMASDHLPLYATLKIRSKAQKAS
jgi:endonuclease/exonuclease/phosphatase family metal-dependent hydrolase